MICDLTIFLDVKTYKSLCKTINEKICKRMERVGGLITRKLDDVLTFGNYMMKFPLTKFIYIAVSTSALRQVSQLNVRTGSDNGRYNCTVIGEFSTQSLGSASYTLTVTSEYAFTLHMHLENVQEYFLLSLLICNFIKLSLVCSYSVSC